MRQTEVPLVTVRVAIKGGVESDPARLAGLASVTAECLRRGTAKRTADQFSDELDRLGATWQTSADNQSSIIETEFLSKDLDAGLDLLLDALIRPTFPEPEVNKLLAQRIDAVKAAKDNPNAAAGLYYRTFYFGADHPYGRPADELSLGRIQRKDIVDYHARMYAGKNMIVVVAGDVEPSRVSPTLHKLLAAFPAGQGYIWAKPVRNEAASTRLAIVDKPDATQTNFMIGQPGIARNHPDRVALWLVNTLFGGRFTSMLNDELRINTGLTYGASSRFDESHLPGRITISSFTEAVNTAKAIDLALEILKRLRDKGITAEQLASAKSYLKGTFPSEHLETSDQLAEALTEIELNDLNRGEIDDLFARIDAVTLQEANAVARKYYRPENLTFLLVGNAAKLRDEVKKYAPSPIVVPLARPGVSLAP
jgi:predicted Zn-dependent peptidase